ncbi:MAG: copper resistance protein NlpE N-terminal domain-containing protein [Fibrobacter sp.]|nr:copper resistance protein NlpE N-terminal domain-containing protein [Fibrobacter sp.]
MKYFVAPLFIAATLFVACSEEKSEPLPDLAPIELPKDVPGLYSGRMPCDDCKARMVRVTLNEDMSASIVQTKIADTLQVDSLAGIYVVTDSTVKITLSDSTTHWNFKRIASGNLSFLTSAGTVYEDESGMPMDLIRIFKAPVATVKAVVESDSSKEK